MSLSLRSTRGGTPGSSISALKRKASSHSLTSASTASSSMLDAENNENGLESNSEAVEVTDSGSASKKVRVSAPNSPQRVTSGGKVTSSGSRTTTPSGIPHSKFTRNSHNTSAGGADSDTSNGTPMKTPSKLLGYIAGSTPASSARNNRALLRGASTPAAEKLAKIFAATITVDEERVRSVTSALNRNKASLKFDFKEKSKRQETAIKDLQALLITLVGQVKTLELKCVGFESDAEARLSEAALQVTEAQQGQNLLANNQKALQKDASEAMERAATAEAALKASRKEVDPLQKLVRSLEGRLAEQVAKVASDSARVRELESEVARISAENSVCKEELAQAQDKTLAELKAAAADHESQRTRMQEESRIALATQKESHDAVLSKMETRFEEGNAALKAEVMRLLTLNDKAQADMLALQSSLSKMEASSDFTNTRLEAATTELDAVKVELSETKKIMSTLESDHRVALNSAESASSQVKSLEADNQTMSVQLATNAAEITQLRRDHENASLAVRKLENTLAGKEAELATLKDASSQLELERELRSRAEHRESSERQERIAASAQLLATQSDCNARIQELERKMRADVEKVKSLLDSSQADLEKVTTLYKASCDTVAGLENEAEELKAQIEHACANHETVEKLGKVSGELEILKRRIRDSNTAKDVEVQKALARVTELEEELRLAEVTRRKLHNTIQELRGNVRVFARVRPFLPSDAAQGSGGASESSIVPRSDGSSLRITRVGSEEHRAEDHAFTFDRVFGPSSSQECVFKEVSEFVQSALDGYNVCLFSYGQTGSGKTHTMQGSGSGVQRGIIARAMEQVGQYKSELESKGWKYHMEVSFIEIYNETIRDLLRTNPTDDIRHDIKRDSTGHTMVTDVTMQEIDPNNSSEIEAIMETAARHRSVGQTAMNERSSRSHSVFCLHLRASNESQGIVLKGALNLVDLAGSERLDRSQATGTRKTETVAINKSLSALTDVFVAIGNKQSHIPFRNSKLTFLLQPALSGDGKTLMMVNLSPTPESYGESVCSLRFASQVNSCELGKPKKQTMNESSITPAGKSNNAGTGSSRNAGTLSGSSSVGTKRLRK